MNQPPDFDSNLSPSPQQNLGQSVAGSRVEGAVQGIQGDYNTQIHIINYHYYREDIRTAPVESAKTSADDNLPCPYRGLFHFGPNDTEFFFGREVFIEELIQATAKRSFIPVLGASGSGKSSVVLAGLVPKLQQQGNWLFTHFRPGSDPFYALAESLVPLYTSADATVQIAQARALARYFYESKVTLPDIFSHIQRQHSNYRVLLIADQFEELYTLCGEPKIRHSFLDTLLASFQSSSGNTNVLVATMRADFLGSALEYRPFADVLHDDIKLGPMNRTELLEVISKPAQKLGVTLEGGLVERILNDVENEPGNLPLLEFALTLLWERRNHRQLTHAAYEAIGEVQGALASHADKIYNNFNAADQQQVQRIFMQLVRPGEGAEDTRRLATKAELGAASWSLVKQLADARLVVTSQNDANQETVEVAHEALIQNWHTLPQWMSINRDFRAWQERLRVVMRQWEEAQRDSGALLRGTPLNLAEDWLQKRSDELTQEEQDFIRASAQQRDREKEEQERGRRLIVLGLINGLIVALSLAGFAGWQWQQSEIAQVKTITVSSEFLFNSNNHFDVLIQSLKAGKILKRMFWAEANTRTEVVNILRRAISEVSERNRLAGHGNSVWSVVFSPDGKTLASASADETIKLWDVATGKQLKTFTGHKDLVYSVVFSPDGKTLASASRDKTIKLWDVTTGKVLKTFAGHRDDVLRVVFSPDGKTLASASYDKTIKLWNIATGKVLKTFTGHRDAVSSVIFSPDGKTLASSSRDKTIKLWDVATGKRLKNFTEHRDVVWSVIFSPDGKTLASASADETIKLWNAATGKLLKTSTGHRDDVFSVVFSPDGKTLASAGNDKTIKLWDIATGRERKTFTGHRNFVSDVSFSRDGKTLASASGDYTIKLWNVTTVKGYNTLTGHSNSVYSIVFSRDGKTLASASRDFNIKLWDVATGKPLKKFIGHRETVWSVIFSPDGKTLASASHDRTIKLWDIATGKQLKSFTGHSDVVSSVIFSPDGKTLASASNDKTIKLWDIATGQVLKTFTEHSNFVNSVSFSSDGKTLASASSDKTIKLWDVATGKVLKTFTGHSNTVYSVVFSADGKTLASGSGDRTIKLWDIATGKLLKTFTGHSNRVYSVAFSADGKTLASASADKTIKLWNIVTGLERTTVAGHNDEVNSVSFSRDGKTLASASDDRTINLWNLTTNLWYSDLDKLLVLDCNWVRHYLKNNPNVSDSDKHLCDGISIGK